MVKLFLISFPLVFLISSCSTIPHKNGSPSNTFQVNRQTHKKPCTYEAIAEGVLEYTGGGGTREVKYTSGYFIKNPRWIKAPCEAPLNIRVQYHLQLAAFKNKYVRVAGMLRKVPGKKISHISYIAAFSEIAADTVFIPEY